MAPPDTTEATPEPVTEPDAQPEPPKPHDYKGKLRQMTDTVCGYGTDAELEQACDALRPLAQAAQARL